MLVQEMFIKPRRIKINAEEDLDYYVNIYNGKKDLYRSVYRYNDTIDIDNVIVDKIYIDFDFDSDMQFLKDVRTVAKYLYDNDYYFYIRFSGNGFHIFILLNDKVQLKNPKVAIRQYVDFLHKTTNTTSDPAVIGDLRRVVRMPNTLNLKHDDRRYCIAITYKELMTKTYEEIRDIAKNKRNVEVFLQGHRLLNISEWDNVVVTKRGSVQECVINTEINDELPPCVKEFMTDPYLGNLGRMQLILYLRDLGYSEQEVEDTLFSFLSDEKFEHSVNEEKQIQHLFNKEYMFSDCNVQKQNGFCPSETCKGHGLYY